MTLRGRLQSNLTNRCHGNPVLTCVSRDLKHTWGQSHWWGQLSFSASSSVPLASLKLMSNLIRALLVFRCANSRTEGRLYVIWDGSVCPTREITREVTTSLVFFLSVCGITASKKRCADVMRSSMIKFLISSLLCDMLCFSSILYTQQYLATTQSLCHALWVAILSNKQSDDLFISW